MSESEFSQIAVQLSAIIVKSDNILKIQQRECLSDDQKKKHSRFKPKVLQTLNFRDSVSVRSGTDLKFRKSRIPVFGQNAVLFCKFARNGVLTFGKSLSCATFCGDSEFLIRKLLSRRIPELSPKNRIFWNEMREVT